MGKVLKNMALTLLFLTLCILLAFMIYLHFFAPGDQDISGNWTAEVDMTDQAALSAFIWLQDIEAVSVSLEEIKLRMGDLTVQVNLNLEQTERFAGNFRCNIVPESYEDCNQAAYEAFAAVFRELAAERLDMAGYTGGTDADAVEALVAGTFGMSTVSYLTACAPALLPSLEEMQSSYDGSGTYETAGGILTRRFETDGPAAVKAEGYIRKESALILTGETDAGALKNHPMVYLLNDVIYLPEE